MQKENIKIKILIYASNTLFEGHRGDSTHVRELVQNLSDFGNRVIVITMAIQPPKNLNYDKFNLYRLRYFSNNFIAGMFISIYAFFMGVFVLMKERPDIIYKFQSSFGDDVLIARLARCPVVTVINGSFSDENVHYKTGIHKLIHNILRYISQQSILQNDLLVAVTSNLKRMIQDELNISPGKIIVITNGANLKLFHPTGKNLSCERLRLHCDFKYICYVGSLVSYQGVEYIIQAAPSILTAFPDTRFLIVGDGPMKNEWMQLAQGIEVFDKFIFTGNVPYENVPSYINVSDICVVYKKPLKSGFSPLKLYEYMACGIPVVASKVDGFEILEQLNAGYLVKPQDPTELAKAIIKLLKDEELREIMGKNGIEYVKTQSWEAVSRKVEKVCEGIISRF